MDVEIRSAIKRRRIVLVFIMLSGGRNLTGENVTKLSEKIKTEGKQRLEGDENKM